MDQFTSGASRFRFAPRGHSEGRGGFAPPPSLPAPLCCGGLPCGGSLTLPSRLSHSDLGNTIPLGKGENASAEKRSGQRRLWGGIHDLPESGLGSIAGALMRIDQAAKQRARDHKKKIDNIAGPGFAIIDDIAERDWPDPSLVCLSISIDPALAHHFSARKNGLAGQHDSRSAIMNCRFQDPLI